MKYGYEPEDVEHAVNHYRNTSFRTPLEYLQHEWEEDKRIVQKTVMRKGQVGQPSLIEARDCLLEVGGSAPDAIETCIAKRTKKVNLLITGEEPVLNITSTQSIYYMPYSLNSRLSNI